jgi:hypothetical protein
MGTGRLLALSANARLVTDNDKHFSLSRNSRKNFTVEATGVSVTKTFFVYLVAK